MRNNLILIPICCAKVLKYFVSSLNVNCVVLHVTCIYVVDFTLARSPPRRISRYGWKPKIKRIDAIINCGAVPSYIPMVRGGCCPHCPDYTVIGIGIVCCLLYGIIQKIYVVTVLTLINYMCRISSLIYCTDDNSIVGDDNDIGIDADDSTVVWVVFAYFEHPDNTDSVTHVNSQISLIFAQRTDLITLLPSCIYYEYYLLIFQSSRSKPYVSCLLSTWYRLLCTAFGVYDALVLRIGYAGELQLTLVIVWYVIDDYPSPPKRSIGRGYVSTELHLIIRIGVKAHMNMYPTEPRWRIYTCCCYFMQPYNNNNNHVYTLLVSLLRPICYVVRSDDYISPCVYLYSCPHLFLVVNSWNCNTDVTLLCMSTLPPHCSECMGATMQYTRVGPSDSLNSIDSTQTITTVLICVSVLNNTVLVAHLLALI